MMYDIMLYIYYTVLNLLPPITYPPFPKREIYQFTVLPFYHPNNAPLLFNTRALLSNKRPLLINMRSLSKNSFFAKRPNNLTFDLHLFVLQWIEHVRSYLKR